VNYSLPAFRTNTKYVYFPVIREESVEEDGGSEDEQPSEEAVVVCMFAFTH